LKDEEAGAKIAQSEQKAEGEAAEAAPEGETKEEEPEDKHITYDQYLAQLAEKKLALEADLQVRRPNEGVKDDKWKDFAPLSKKDEEEELFAGTGGKAKRERERKTKQFVELENRYIEPERTRGGRGGRGGARGDGGRGRGRGAPRGEFRGGRGGGRSQESKPLDTSDESAFPSLGGGK
jgi:plasminogen activator inhibitor 1 RNA-binding protein